MIAKGTLLRVTHTRKGTFKGIATKDFDPDTADSYPVAVAEEIIEGIATRWGPGENIPCRARLCSVEVI